MRRLKNFKVGCSAEWVLPGPINQFRVANLWPRKAILWRYRFLLWCVKARHCARNSWKRPLFLERWDIILDLWLRLNSSHCSCSYVPGPISLPIRLIFLTVGLNSVFLYFPATSLKQAGKPCVSVRMGPSQYSGAAYQPRFGTAIRRVGIGKSYRPCRPRTLHSKAVMIEICQFILYSCRRPPYQRQMQNSQIYWAITARAYWCMFGVANTCPEKYCQRHI